MPYTSNLYAVVDAWSGGFARTKSGSEALCIFGSGHNDNGDNSLYCLNLASLTWSRPSGPQVYTDADYGNCPVGLPSSSPTAPNAVHSTDNLAYLISTDQLHKFNGGIACGNGFHTADQWTYDFAGASWTRNDPTSGFQLACSTLTNAGSCGSSGYDGASVYDPTSQEVFQMIPVAGTVYIASWTPATNVQTNTLTSHTGGEWLTWDVDPAHNLIIGMGRESSASSTPHIMKLDISNPASPVLSDLAVDSSCTTIAGAFAPGFSYYSVDGLFYAWPVNGTTTYYTYDDQANTCTAHSAGGSAPANVDGNFPVDGGIYGRFRCIAAKQGCYVVTNVAADTFKLDLSSGGTTPMAVIGGTRIKGGVKIQ